MAQVCSGFQLTVPRTISAGRPADDPSVNSGNPMTMDCWFKMIKIVERRKFRVEDVEPLGLEKTVLNEVHHPATNATANPTVPNMLKGHMDP